MAIETPALVTLMNSRYDVGLLGFTLRTDSDGLRFSNRMGTRRVAWETVEAAGVLQERQVKLPANLPRDLVPGLHNLNSYNNRMASECVSLWIACRAGRRARVQTVAVPRKDFDELAAELCGRIGERWSVQPRNLLEVRKQFGVSNWWVPISALAITAACGVVLLAFWGGYFTIRNFIEVLAYRYWILAVMAVLGWWAYRKIRRRAPGSRL